MPGTATATKHTTGGGVDREPVGVTLLRSRAADLRLTATEFEQPVASAYRRRAAELELEAAALAARLGVVEHLGLAA